MGSWRRILFLPHLLVNLVGLTIAQPDMLYHLCNFTSDSTYQTNVGTLLSSLPSNVNNFGFYSSSAGENSDRVYANLLCRGDVEPDNCRSCVRDSANKLVQLCPNYKEAIGGYDNCVLRYTNNSINGVMTVGPRFFVWNDKANVSSLDQYNQSLITLLQSLRNKAASGGPDLKFATGNTVGPDSQSIYALVQCTPDISEQDCINCLDVAYGDLPECCIGRAGGRVIRPSCNFRFETNSPFYGAPASQGKKDNKTRTVIAIVVPTTTLLIVLIVCIFILIRKRKKKVQRKPLKEVETETEIINVESLQHDFGTIRIATDDFSDANKLGQGGFGAVYRGRLPNGQEIAVKRLASNSRQGEMEFKNEVMLMAKLQHRNLVRLLGFCLEGTERLLIYEFVSNSSLDRFIFDPIKRAHLDWDIRYKIIEGTARGLLYLHEDSLLRIIHRDIKASNILLDAEMNPKIADFGLARLFDLDESHGSTNKIAGTFGYMAPEYVMQGQFSVKSDVFSFGVLILEIVSGQKNNHFHIGESEEDILSYAWKSWREGTASNLIDPTFRTGSGSMREMMRCIHIGLLCVQRNVAERPTMASVFLMLSSFSFTLPSPSEPGFFMHSGINPEAPFVQEYKSRVNRSSQSKSNSTTLSQNEASITELYPR